MYQKPVFFNKASQLCQGTEKSQEHVRLHICKLQICGNWVPDFRETEKQSNKIIF